MSAMCERSSSDAYEKSERNPCRFKMTRNGLWMRRRKVISKRFNNCYRRLKVSALMPFLPLSSSPTVPGKQSKLLALCEYLLQSGADPNHVCRYGPLICSAATTGSIEYVVLLLRFGAKSTIHTASATGDLANVKKLLKREFCRCVQTRQIGKNTTALLCWVRSLESQFNPCRRIGRDRQTFDCCRGGCQCPNPRSSSWGHATLLRRQHRRTRRIGEVFLLENGADPNTARTLL